jgi:ribosome biogenesis protein BRX1
MLRTDIFLICKKIGINNFNMNKNADNLKSVFLFSEMPINKTIIATSSKKCGKLKKISQDLHNIIPDSKISNNTTNKDYRYEFEYNILTQNNISMLFLKYKKKNSYLLISNAFYCLTYQLTLLNICTYDDYRFIGNCQKWSKSILMFDENFNEKPHLIILKPLLVEIFTSKSRNKLSKPVIDNVISFVYYKSKILLRIYQIKYLKNANSTKKTKNIVLLEIGPRITFFPSKAWSNLTENKETIFDFRFKK